MQLPEHLTNNHKIQLIILRHPVANLFPYLFTQHTKKARIISRAREVQEIVKGDIEAIIESDRATPYSAHRLYNVPFRWHSLG